ncbi:MAG: KilA-N domain-containing protein [Aliarcobacter sp.]|nr:KilA-N domain-containing protein [Aliarcobacter sp.]
MAKMIVQEQEITILRIENEEYISLTDMIKSKDGDFFISNWLRNRNTIEYLGIWEKIHNPNFNYGKFAIIKSQAGLNNYKLSVKEWSEKTSAIGFIAKLNYKIHTDAIKENLIPKELTSQQINLCIPMEQIS